MNNLGERIHTLRKALGLTMEEFGKKIGMSKSSVSGIENEKNGASERTIRLICSTWGVDYYWLTRGEGEMFLDSTDYIIDELAAEKHWDSETVDIMKKMFALPEDKFNLVMQLIESMSEKDK